MLLKNKAVQIWARRLHIYISMALLLVVLFFSVTGITLNRPEFFVTSEPTVDEVAIQLPNALIASGSREFVPDEEQLVAFLTEQAEISGKPSDVEIFTEVENGELLEGEISLNYKGPGFNASVFIDLTTQEAVVEKSHYGVIAVLNDLHKGRNSGEVWKWFIDITALLMVFFVLTGVCLLFPKKKTFSTSLKWTAVGSLATLLIFIFAVP
ncbi:PepSY-associated TM helix domain-containing protein [Photobacterium sp. SDRW27]|uniref:PepSY-associated TM helix domain-containing protein n=1 Tax=Photobacterium obscurum TaxID=2829490 RepID=UPI002243B58F|nr:PepSY-associated TM helix domain-containing protein [Photobacterium obscurum]MCW8331734.1 PepSY-associated TM helix domain-containing protein [Photobacterium obscurum]